MARICGIEIKAVFVAKIVYIGTINRLTSVTLHFYSLESYTFYASKCGPNITIVYKC